MKRAVEVLVFGIFAFPLVAYADIVIFEIMYDAPGADTGHEWVEIFNDGSTDVSIEGWKLLENGTKHKLTAVAGGYALPPGGYAIIADNATTFSTDVPQFRGQLFDSAFSLSNNGETLSLLGGSGAIVDSISYQGSASEGNSLNTSGSSFVAREPSPGAAMSASSIEPPPKAQQSSNSKKTASADRSSEAEATTIVGELDIEGTSTVIMAGEKQAAAVSVFSSAALPWWGAAGAIAAAAGGALFFARSKKKDEWNIIEGE